MTFASFHLSFNQQIPDILIKHSPNGSKGLQKITLNEGHAVADLSLSTGQTKYLQFSYTPVGEAQIEVVILLKLAEIDLIALTITTEWNSLCDDYVPFPRNRSRAICRDCVAERR